MMPEFIMNLFRALDSSTRIVLKTCEGCEKIVDGVDEIATIQLKRTKKEMLAKAQQLPA